MSQRPYLRAFCKARKFHFLISFTKNFINPSRLSLEVGSKTTTPCAVWSEDVSLVLLPGYLWYIHHRFDRRRLASKTYGDNYC